MEMRILERMENFLDNHWPHLTSRVGNLEGQVKILLGITTLTLAGIITMLVQSW